MAARYPAAESERMRALVSAARERALVADSALEKSHGASALTLYREAALFHMAAYLAVEASEPPPEVAAPDEIVARFRGLPLGPSVPESLFTLVAAPPAPANTPEVIARAETARTTVRWLDGLVEPRGVAELRFERRLRVGVAGIAVLALLAWGLPALFGARNIALHKPTTSSGVFPGAHAEPGGLTDGVISGAPYGVHTQVGDKPWVQIDLLAVYKIDKVKIYNRGDGYFDDGLPMTLQFSENGVTFVDVETRAASFSQSAPWVAKARGRSARYVRIVGARGKYVTLSEVEVFAL